MKRDDERIDRHQLIQPPRRRDRIVDGASECAVASEVAHFGFDVVVGERLLQTASGMQHRLGQGSTVRGADRGGCGASGAVRVYSRLDPVPERGDRRRVDGVVGELLAARPHRTGRRPRRNDGC